VELRAAAPSAEGPRGSGGGTCTTDARESGRGSPSAAALAPAAAARDAFGDAGDEADEDDALADGDSSEDRRAACPLSTVPAQCRAESAA
jgi:hypothetical protein